MERLTDAAPYRWLDDARHSLQSGMLAFAGCASYSDIQSLPPLIEVASTKPPAEYAGCIMPKARERWKGYASIGHDGAAQVVTIAVDPRTPEERTAAGQKERDRRKGRGRRTDGRAHRRFEYPYSVRTTKKAT